MLPLYFETLIALMLAFLVGLIAAWLVWGRRSR